MQVSVRVDSSTIIESCQSKIKRIEEKRLALRAEWIAVQMRPPSFLGRVFGDTQKTKDQAEAMALKLEKCDRAEWTHWFEVTEERCLVLSKMAQHAPYLDLNYDEFCIAGLAR